MKIKLLMNSNALQAIISAKLNEVGLTDSDIVDYNKALLPQLVDANVIVNDFSKIDPCFAG